MPVLPLTVLVILITLIVMLVAVVFVGGFVISIKPIGGGVPSVGGRLQAEREAADRGESSYSQIGAVRLDLMRAFPFATLVVSASQLDLFILGRRYTFPKASILSLSFFSYVINSGIRIEHSNLNIPLRVLFSPSNFARLTAELEARGYSIRGNPLRENRDPAT